jgi:hypothetical protein
MQIRHAGRVQKRRPDRVSGLCNFCDLFGALPEQAPRDDLSLNLGGPFKDV